MKNKLKDNSGYAMVLSIFSIIIVSLIGIYITNQIGNQLKSSKSTYENMQVTYITELGIEKTIYDLENQIYNKNINMNTKANEWIGVDHSNHDSTKVGINSDGSVNLTNFNNLIYYDLVHSNANDSIASIFSTLFMYLNWIGGDFVDPGPISTDLKNQLEAIRATVDIIRTNGNTKSNVDKLINQLNTCTKKIDLMIDGVNNTSSQYKDECIAYLNRMNSILEEMLCRLGSLDSYISKSIDIHTYDTKIYESGNSVSTSHNFGSTSVLIKYEDGEIVDINFDQLNKFINNKKLYAVGISEDDRLTIKKTYDLKFSFNKQLKSIIVDTNNIETSII